MVTIIGEDGFEPWFSSLKKEKEKKNKEEDIMILSYKARGFKQSIFVPFKRKTL